MSVSADPSALARVEVETAAGVVVARAGPRTSDEALVLLHGAAGTWTTWRPLLDLTDSADVVAPDLPGWGESGDAADVRRVEDLTDAVVEAVRALGYRSWRVAGHSLGGFVGLDLAARHPDATAGVVLVSPTGPAVVDAVRRPLRGGARLPWFAGMLFTMRTLSSLGGAGTALVHGVGRTGLMPLLAAPLFAGPADRAVARALPDEIRPRSFARAARYAARYDLAHWSGITAPVEAVRGERDVFSGAADAAGFAALIPRFHEKRLADAGHFAHIERPDAVLDALARTRS